MFSFYCRLNISIWASDCEVIRAAWPKFSPLGKSRSRKTIRRQVYTALLACHHNQQELAAHHRL